MSSSRFRAAVAFFAGLAGVLPGAPGRAAAPAGYVHASGERIVDGSGADLILRGVNLGGWLLWESYLMRFEGHDLTESRMKQGVVDLVGREAAFRFFREYRDNHTTRADLARIRKLGLNCVRVPINSRILSPAGHFDMAPGEGWRILDRLLDDCESLGLYAILDLHSPPGGANPGGITDQGLKAGLFDGDSTTAFRDETVALWKEIAHRYSARTIVAAYDLLNEPAVDSKWGGGGALFEVYRRLVAAVREADSRHMIMVEGNWYATDFSMFGTPPLDSNLCYQFHKYWDEPSPRSIQRYLELSRRLSAPVWLGETGENSHQWYAWCVQALNEAGIGWCFWPWKRLGEGCVEAVEQPPAWRKTSAALGDPEKRAALSPADAIAGLKALAAAVRLGSCREDARTTAALRGEYSAFMRMPGKVNAADYSRCAVARKGNQGGAFRPGDADIYEDGEGVFVVRGLDAGDELSFDIELLAPDLVRPVLHGATGFLEAFVDGKALPAEGRRISAGRHVLAVRSRSAGGALRAIELTARPGRIEAEDFVPGREVGYHDADGENHGKSAYRKEEAVSVEPCSEGGCNVGWIDAGDWFTWDIDVPHAGRWDLLIRYSSLSGGGPLSISIGDRTVAASIEVPSTGWWQNWADLRVPGLDLPAGRQKLRLDAAKGGFNLNYFLFLPR